MEVFNQWTEAGIFAAIYSVFIVIPCIIVCMMGLKMMDRLGRWPSKAPEIIMKYCVPLAVLEVITFICLVGFLLFFIDNK